METRSWLDAWQKCLRNSGKRAISEKITQMSSHSPVGLHSHDLNEISSMARRRSATIPLPHALPYIIISTWNWTLRLEISWTSEHPRREKPGLVSTASGVGDDHQSLMAPTLPPKPEQSLNRVKNPHQDPGAPARPLCYSYFSASLLSKTFNAEDRHERCR